MSDDGMDQSDGAVLSGDAWEQSQYLPSASLSLMTEDPKKKTPPPPLHRVLTGDEWERAQRLPGPAIRALQLPPIPQLAAPVDDTANPLSSRTKGKALAPFDLKDPTTYANPVLRQIVNPALDNPLTTAITTVALAPAMVAGRVGALTAAELPALRASSAVGRAMAGQMVHSIASYGWQKLAEMDLSPEDRKRAEADPERVSGEAAAVQAAMLGLAPLIHVGVKAMSGPSYGAGMLEAGASGVHETLADPSVAPNRTAPFQGELNAAHAHALEEGAATTRIPADTPKPEGFQATAGGARLKTNPRAPEGLVVPDKITTGKISPLDTQTPDQPLQDAANINEAIRGYQQGRLEQDQSDVSAARQADADRIAKETAMRPRRRPAKVPMFDTEQGAQVLGAQAARHGLPDSASPYHPTSPTTAVLDAAWREGHDAGSQTGQSMLASMADSGFATAPADASSVILPSEGAGRAGSTVDAVAIAKKLVGSAQLRVLADAELAKRGGPVTPEAQMAAMEQVARNLASREPQPSYPDGFSMGGALTDNRIPGAVELPKTAKGSDVPEGATPESVALANALKPSPFRGHTTDALAEAALDAQARVEAAQKAVVESQTKDHALWNDPEQTPEHIFYEDRGREAGATPSSSSERQLQRAKTQLAQIEREFAMRGVSGDALAEVIQQAKEQRLERAGMQSDEALNAHMGADDPFGETPAPTAAPGTAASGSASGLTPVPGTGETVTRGLSRGVEATAVANKLATTLGDLPEYQRVNMADQASRATDLVASDPALARQVALGEAPAPHGLLPESVFAAVEHRAIADGDVATLRDLATGKLTSEATTMGQRIRALAERDPESPVGAIDRVAKAREATVGDVPQATAKVVADIQKILTKNKLDPAHFQAFIDSLRC